MVQKIVDLLSKGEWEEAIELWRQSRNKGKGCAEICIWGGAASLMKCARCLEGRLLSISLSFHTGDGVEDTYLQLARKMNLWSRKLEN